MNVDRKLLLFVPTYNTSKVRGVIEQLDYLRLITPKVGNGYELHVLVIDDGSDEPYPPELERLTSDKADWLTLVQHDENQGNFATVLEGYRWLVEQSQRGDLLGCCDGDGEHDPLAFVRYMRLAELHYGFIGSIAYPVSDATRTDHAMMQFLGGLQAKLFKIGGKPENVPNLHSCGFQLHPHDPLAVVVKEDLPAYFEFFLGQTGEELPRWGLHGVVNHLMALRGAKLEVAHLSCFGQAPDRTSDKMIAQAKAALVHAEMVTAFTNRS